MEIDVLGKENKWTCCVYLSYIILVVLFNNSFILAFRKTNIY